MKTCKDLQKISVRKIHLCVDEKNGQIVASTLTDNSLVDSEIFGDLLGDLKNHIPIALQNPHINFLGRIVHMEVVGQKVA